MTEVAHNASEQGVLMHTFNASTGRQRQVDIYEFQASVVDIEGSRTVSQGYRESQSLSLFLSLSLSHSHTHTHTHTHTVSLCHL